MTYDITKRLIGKQDINWWTGSASKTFTHTTGDGEILTLTKVGNSVDVLAISGATTGEAISDSITEIGSELVALNIAPGTWTIDDDLTIPSNIPLNLEYGAILQIASGKTLTINSPFTAGLYQVFSDLNTSLDGVQFADGAVKLAPPEWWGAVCDGETDAADYCLAAMNSGAPATELNPYLCFDSTWSVDRENFIIYANEPLICNTSNGGTGYITLDTENVIWVGGKLTSDIKYGRFTAGVDVTDTRLYVSNASSWTAGDTIHSEPLWGDSDGATITAVGADYIDVDTAPTQSQHASYMPSGASADLRAPAGTYFFEGRVGYGEWQPPLVINSSKVGVVGPKFEYNYEALWVTSGENSIIVDPFFDKQFCEHINFGHYSGEDVEVTVSGGKFGDVLDLFKSCVSLTNINTHVTFLGSSFRSNATDAFVLTYGDVQGSKIIMNGVSMLGHRPDFMTTDYSGVAADYGYAPGSYILLMHSNDTNIGNFVSGLTGSNTLDIELNGCNFELGSLWQWGVAQLTSTTTLGVGGLSLLQIIGGSIAGNLCLGGVGTNVDKCGTVRVKSAYLGECADPADVYSCRLKDIDYIYLDDVTSIKDDSTYGWLIYGNYVSIARNCTWIENSTDSSNNSFYVSNNHIQHDCTYIGWIQANSTSTPSGSIFQVIKDAVFISIPDDYATSPAKPEYLGSVSYKSYNGGKYEGEWILATMGGSPANIEGMTRADPCVVTWTGHGLYTSKHVVFAGITQTDWTALIGTHEITKIDDDTFSIDVDTTGYAAVYNAGTDPGTVDYTWDWHQRKVVRNISETYAGFGSDWYLPLYSTVIDPVNKATYQVDKSTVRTCSGGASASATSFTVDDDSGIAASDFILISHDDGSVYRYKVDSGYSSGTTINLQSGGSEPADLVEDVADGANICFYTLSSW